MKQKSFPVQEQKDDSMTIHLKKKKAWVRAKTVRSEQFSFYERAKRRERQKLKKELKEYIDK